MPSPKLPEVLASDLIERVRARFEHWPVTEGLGLKDAVLNGKSP